LRAENRRLAASALILGLFNLYGCTVPVEIRSTYETQSCPAETPLSVTPFLGVKTTDGNKQSTADGNKPPTTVDRIEMRAKNAKYSLIIFTVYFVPENDNQLANPIHFKSETSDDLKIAMFRPASQIQSYLHLVTASRKLCFNFFIESPDHGNAYIYSLGSKMQLGASN
jgi:hypothetical protein